MLVVPSLVRTAIRKRTNVLSGAAFVFAFLVLAPSSSSSSSLLFDVSSSALPSLCFASAFSATRITISTALPKTKTKPSNHHRCETRSCPPPRFDDFSESLVGAWTIQELGSDSNNNNNDENNNHNEGTAVATVVVDAADLVADVEEVMRSCGGAVQGIREPATTASLIEGDETNTTPVNGSSSTYLNRANDGFVFFDDGCYTMGPVFIGNRKEVKDDAAAFLSCLALPEGDLDGRKQRLVVSFGGVGGNSSNTTQLARAAAELISLSHTATMRTKRRFGDQSSLSANIPVGSEIPSSDNVNEAHEDPASEDEEITCTTFTIEEIKRIVRCRMPSEGQPWMLQRAKWETLLPSPGARGAIDASTDHQAQEDTNSVSAEYLLDEPFRWVISEPAQAFYERLGIATTVVSYEGIMVQCGLVCKKSKSLRVLARQYQFKNNAGAAGNDATAALCGVLRVEGTVGFGSADVRMGGNRQK